ncbi:isoamyl acetate-hydrolyzing esterase [[Candida] anglica]|uniref:Isoamyl acetate-hydrolyzing esterase n=1 Tax=[Candida] anglica TaxID=148631 RepID=A0ABP0EF00_9ASCO
MGLDYNKFLLFGDSITEWSYRNGGFGALLQNDYARKMDVVCRGFSGFNSNHAVEILPKLLEMDKYSIMTIFFGTNDALNTFQGVPIDKTKKNLKFLVELSLKSGIKVILIGPALHSRELYRAANPDDDYVGSEENNRKYCEAAKSVSMETGVPFIDLCTEFDNSGLPINQLLVDGIHFTSNGYKILYESISNTIKSVYPEYSYENISPSLVLWRELEPAGDNPKKIRSILYRNEE